MSGSIDLKRKRPMEEDSRKTPKRLRSRRGCCNERCTAILRLVGMSKPRRQKNSAKSNATLSDQIALLEEMLHKGDQFDIRAEKTRLKAELRRAKEDVKAIKVPFVDWEKLGEGWFWSQP
ncbi:hypothetical protein Bca4012_035358 [Brassica carinata]